MKEKSDCSVYDGVVTGLKCELKRDTASEIYIVSKYFVDSSSKRVPADFSLK